MAEYEVTLTSQFVRDMALVAIARAVVGVSPYVAAEECERANALLLRLMKQMGHVACTIERELVLRRKEKTNDGEKDEQTN